MRMSARADRDLPVAVFRPALVVLQSLFLGGGQVAAPFLLARVRYLSASENLHPKLRAPRMSSTTSKNISMPNTCMRAQVVRGRVREVLLDAH